MRAGVLRGGMDVVLISFPSSLFEMAFTLALVAGGLLLLGGIVSGLVYAYKSISGEGVRDPREAVPEKAETDDGLTKGDEDDEWDYY